MSPGLAEEDSKRSRGLWRKATAAIIALKDDEEHKSVIRIQQKRLAEIVRRTTEGAILLFVGGILCFNSDVKQLLLQWKTGEHDSRNRILSQTNKCRGFIPDFVNLHADSPVPNSSAATCESNRSLQTTTFVGNTSGF
jgi:hypothetical protein